MATYERLLWWWWLIECERDGDFVEDLCEDRCWWGLGEATRWGITGYVGCGATMAGFDGRVLDLAGVARRSEPEASCVV